MRLLKIFFVTFCFLVNPFDGECQKIFLDHVISVVPDIEIAEQELQDQGFRIKKGTLHTSGLINAHVKFDNGSSFELMSLQGVPQDEMAKEYKALLEEGEGGVFLSLSGVNCDSMSFVLKKLGIDHEYLSQNSWNYITFPANSGLEHIFFIEYKILIDDPEEIFAHQNGIQGIQKVYVQGDQELIKFLGTIGMRSLRIIHNTEWGQGVEFPTPTGSLIVIPAEQGKRPRIRSVVFSGEDNSKNFVLNY